MSKEQVLIAARDKRRAEHWRYGLQADYQITVCDAADTFPRQLDFSVCRLLVMQIPFADADDVGFLAGRLRSQEHHPGIILVAPELPPALRTQAMSCGVDMLLAAPVAADELRLAVRQLMGRLRPEYDPGGWSLDPTTWSLYAPGGTSVQLSFRERQFLRALASQPGEPVSKEMLILGLGSDPGAFDARRLEITVRRLRKRLKEVLGVDLPILTAHGYGYALGVDVAIRRKASAAAGR